MNKLQGIVEETSTRQVNGKFGPSTVYNFRINGEWYGAGFKDPGAKQGDMVEFVLEMNGQYKNAKDTVVLASGDTPSGDGSSQAAAQPAPAALAPNKRELSIHYQSCRKDAIAVMALLLEQDAIPIKATKQADKMDILLGFVNELTERYLQELRNAVDGNKDE